MPQDTGTETATDPITTATTAIDLLNTVAEQQKNQSTDDVQFYEYGRILVGLLDTLGKITLNLTNHVSHYDDDLILRDDLGSDPEGRVTDACTYLGELHTAINIGKRHAHHYWLAISHISVEFNPNTNHNE